MAKCKSILFCMPMLDSRQSRYPRIAMTWLLRGRPFRTRPGRALGILAVFSYLSLALPFRSRPTRSRWRICAARASSSAHRQ